MNDERRPWPTLPRRQPFDHFAELVFFSSAECNKAQEVSSPCLRMPSLPALINLLVMIEKAIQVAGVERACGRENCIRHVVNRLGNFWGNSPVAELCGFSI